jgi:hypothetical protein
MPSNAIDPISHAIFEAVASLGAPNDPKLIAEQVLRMQKGLSAEDEFSLMLSGLGKVKLIHKLDQFQTPPLSKQMYQVPDLLVVFDYEGQSIPVLVEIKTCSKSALKWRVDYWNKLKKYADLLNLPLLVACKWEEGPFLWTMVDIDSFKRQEQTYKLTMEESLYQNLMFTLAGNFALIFKKGTALNMTGHKLSEPEKTDKNTFKTTCKLDGQLYYTDSDGKVIEETPKEIFSFFLGGEDTLSFEGDLIHLKFTTPENMFRSADKVFSSLISGEKNIQWREILVNFGVPKSGPEILNQIKNSKVIDKVLIIKPRINPGFMEKVKGTI